MRAKGPSERPNLPLGCWLPRLDLNTVNMFNEMALVCQQPCNPHSVSCTQGQGVFQATEWGASRRTEIQIQISYK
jgi:hypothetical protein